MKYNTKHMVLIIFLFLIIISVPSLSASDLSSVNTLSTDTAYSNGDIDYSLNIINGNINSNENTDYSSNSLNINENTDYSSNSLNINENTDYSSNSLNNSLSNLEDLINLNTNGTLDLDNNYSYKINDNKEGIVISKEITINGNGHRISGENISRIFNITSSGRLTLNDLQISFANQSFGGAIYSEGELIIRNCEFSNNYADCDGGAIYTYNTLEIEDSIFANNSAGGNAKSNSGGGALFLDSNNNVSISKSEFYNNSVYSGDGGGAIYNYGSLLNISSSSFYNNIAKPKDVYYGGGAIFSKNLSKNYIYDSNFHNNYALNDGGAIAVYGGSTLEINNSEIYNNIADSTAGGIYIENSLATLDNLSIYNNTAFLGGGGISIMYSDEISPITQSVVNILNSNFYNNKVTEDYGGGAGAVMSIESTVNLDKCNIYNNTAVNYGGAIGINEGVLTLSYSNIVNNFDENNISVYLVQGGFRGNYNWWGSNDNPKNLVKGEYSSPTINNWVIMGFTTNETPIKVSDKVLVKVSLSNYTSNGNDSYPLSEYMPQIPVAFSSDNGIFTPSTTQVINGEASSIYESMEKGDNILNATIDNQSLFITFNNISLIKTIINNSSLVTYYNDTIDVNVITENGDNVSKGNVSIYEGSTLIGQGYIINGSGKITTNLSANSYNVSVQYHGDNSSYEASNKTLELTIKAKETSIISNDIIMEYKDGTYFTAKLVSDNTPLANQTVSFLINTRYYEYITNSSGEAQIIIRLNPKSYPITVLFNGTSNYLKSNKTNNLTVVPTKEQKIILSANNITMNHLDGTQFIANLTNAVNETMAGEEVALLINGVSYYLTTDSNGLAKLNIRLLPGTYTIESSFSKENYQTVRIKNIVVVKDSSKKETTLLKGPDINMYHKDGSRFIGTLTDSKENPLSGKTVGILINTVLYNLTSDDKGQVKLPINLNSGLYQVNLYFSGDENYSKSTDTGFVSVKTPGDNRLLTSFNVLSTTIIRGNPYELKLFDENKKALFNEKVTISVNGVDYQVTTDSTGTARLSINLHPKTYIITAQYMGSTTHKASFPISKMMTVV